MTDIHPIFIRRAADGVVVPATLHDGIEARQIEDWESLWIPAQSDLIGKLQAAGVPRQDLPQSSHWNWEKKYEAYEGLLSSSFPQYCL